MKELRRTHAEHISMTQKEARYKEELYRDWREKKELAEAQLRNLKDERNELTERLDALKNEMGLERKKSE